MRRRTHQLHGSAPDTSPTALLLIDVINDLDFPGSEELLAHCLPMARQIAELRRRAREASIPTIYVNDNFGRWRSDFRAQVDHCLRDGGQGKPVVELLKPAEDDYFVLKPKHSGFYSTALDLLLDHLEVRRLILAGIAGNLCVLFTANDAYMRDFDLVVPRDCVASNSVEENEGALRQMQCFLKAEIGPSEDLTLARPDDAGLD